LEELFNPAKDLKTIKRFPPSLRGTIYESMLEAVSEELSIWRDSIREQKTSFYDVDTMSLERLTEICGTFGVPFVTSVKSDMTFLREEVRSIPFKIYYKGTPTLYKSFFYAIDRYGEMFIYVYRADINDIMRSMLEPFDDAFLTPPNLPFRHRSRGDFSGSIEDWLTLDSGLFLDAGDALWRLDTSATEISTNHIGLEYFIDRIITRKDKDLVTGVETTNDYLMTKEYLDYINQSMEFARRTKEVPHIGSQLSIQTDASGLCNSFDPDSEYTIPSLKLKAVTRPDFFDLVSTPHDITHIEFGVKKRKVPSVQNPDVEFPEDLASKVCSVPVLFKNQLTDAHFIGAIGEYLGQSLNGFKVLDGSAFDGNSQTFDFELPFAPIQRGNIKLEFRLPTGEILPIADDFRGAFISLNGSGTIDYKTGACQLTTKFNYSQVDNMEPGIQTESEPANKRKHCIFTLPNGTSVVPGSAWITFTIGEGANQRTYMVNDIPNPGDNPACGTFSHSFVKQGIINYSTKTIDITFVSALVESSVKPFTCKYCFPIDYTLPAGTVLLASYFFTQQSILITEAGFRDKDGVLLNYATFPPFEFNSTAYHLDLMILVKRPLLP
jgi:hypothetical protein